LCDDFFEADPNGTYPHTPLADPEGPGEVDVPIEIVSLSLSSTDNEGIFVAGEEEDHPWAGTLATLEVDPGCIIASPDDLRGGALHAEGFPYDEIVFQTGSIEDPNSECLCLVPACWFFEAQCHGDSDGDGEVTLSDFFDLRDGFTTYDACADNNRDGDISLADFFELRDEFGTPEGDCEAGDLLGTICP
jgi:hypothetical protein